MKKCMFAIGLPLILCAVVANAAPEKGTMVDSRDGKTYKTVQIGSQTWMAENLNFETKDSYCYGKTLSNCAKYGRLYTWADAKEACPSGWHLPDDDEFTILFSTVGGKIVAAKMLKSTSGWDEGGNGSDEFGFSALPAGTRSDDGGHAHQGVGAFFWTSIEDDSEEAYSMYLRYDYSIAGMTTSNKHNAHSVRCLAD